MWLRFCLAVLIVALNTACVKEENSRNDNSLRMTIATEVISISYRVTVNDQVFETVTYDPSKFDALDETVLAKRQYVVQGAYETLIGSKEWGSSIQTAPGRAAKYNGMEYLEGLRQSFPEPAITLWATEGPVINGHLVVAGTPIPTRGKPNNGLGRNWASERAWMGQMVGQFLDVVGPPKLNPEDYVNRVPEARRNQLPLKLNFSDYR